MRDTIMTMIDVAMGRNKAQLVFKNVNLINVFTGEIYRTDVAVHDGYIAGIGEYQGAVELNMEGKYLCPSFIDGHVHIESSFVTPGEYAKSVVPRGTTTVVADPHEIGNVKGIAGIKYMIEGAENVPLNVHIMLPSCVPSTPFENAGTVLKSEDLIELINHPKVLGLGEMMDYPSVISCEKSTINKIVLAKNVNKFIDGHAPGVVGKDLGGYVMSGIRTDHECVTPEEAMQRLRLGVHVMFREGSAARNIIGLLPAINEYTIGRCMFCTDDRHPEDILQSGHIDNNIRVAIENGLEPVKAIQMATINAARCYNIEKVGAIAPGYKADLVILNDLETVEVYQVYKKGRLVAENGKPLFNIRSINDSKMRNSVNIKPLTDDCFTFTEGVMSKRPLHNRIIGIQAHSLVTKDITIGVYRKNEQYFTEDGMPLLKIAVVERHHATGNVGLALLLNMGLRNGAIASSVAHDSHNIVVAGDNDKDMRIAVEHLQHIGGGITIASEGKIINTLALPIAGLMSDLSIDLVQEKLEEMLKQAYGMGVNPEIDPFMTLSFMALPVIPELKITDLGLFDVVNFKFV